MVRVQVETSIKSGFRGMLTSSDLKYKQALVDGIRDKYQFTPRIKNLTSVLAPNELKGFLKLFPRKSFDLGRRMQDKFGSEGEFEYVKNGVHRINLHLHTKHSDGSMSVDEYLDQAKRYSDKVAKTKSSNCLPVFISSITDHNKLEGSQEAIAQIAEEPEKYKNFRFVAGCEFMFLDESSGFKFPAFEAVGLGLNPFDSELSNNLQSLNSISIIDKIKEFGGILSYAHPIRFCQGNGLDKKFIEYLTKIGINGIESNYQYLNFKNTPEIKEEITKSKKIAKEFNLWETGGTDSHCKNIFHHRAEKILDELI